MFETLLVCLCAILGRGRYFNFCFNTIKSVMIKCYKLHVKLSKYHVLYTGGDLDIMGVNRVQPRVIVITDGSTADELGRTEHDENMESDVSLSPHFSGSE